MSVATQHALLIFTYCMMVAWRARLISIRWRLPLVHGPGYFLTLRVPDGFLASHGAGLLMLYQRWLALPWLVEAVTTTTLIVTGHFYSGLVPLIAGVAVVDVINYLMLLRHVRRTVKAFAIEDPPMRVALPLQPRTLRTYTKPWLEVLIGASLAGCFSLLIWHGDENRYRIVVIATYVQLGLLLIKQTLVDRRTRFPVENAQAYHHLQELRRGVMINKSDWARGFAALFVVILTVVDFFGEAAGQWMTVIWLACILVMMRTTARQSQRMFQVSYALKPTEPRGIPVEGATGLLIYRPDDPAVFVKAKHGYAVNFGNPRTLVCAAYVIGGVILGAANLRA